MVLRAPKHACMLSKISKAVSMILDSELKRYLDSKAVISDMELNGYLDSKATMILDSELKYQGS